MRPPRALLAAALAIPFQSNPWCEQKRASSPAIAARGMFALISSRLIQSLVTLRPCSRSPAIVKVNGTGTNR